MSDAFCSPYLLGLRAQERPADPLVCCIVPAYNESANIVPMLQTLHQLLADAGYRHELIVVDDGSRDDTVEQVLSHSADLPVTLIQLSRNFGKEIALTAGIDHVRGDIAVLIDSDFQHPRKWCRYSWKSGARAMTWSTAYAAAAKTSRWPSACSPASSTNWPIAAAATRCRPTPRTSACCTAAWWKRCARCRSATAS